MARKYPMTLLEIKLLWMEAVDAFRLDFMNRLERYWDNWASGGNTHSVWRYESMKATVEHMVGWSADEWAEYNVCEETRQLTIIAVKRARCYIIARDKGIAEAVLYKLSSE